MSKSLEALDKLCDLAAQDSTCLNYVIGLAINIKQYEKFIEWLKDDDGFLYIKPEILDKLKELGLYKGEE